MEKIVIQSLLPKGKLNFGGVEWVDLSGKDLRFLRGIQGVKILDLSKSRGLRGKWNFSEMEKVFLCQTNLKYVNYIKGAKIMTFYGATDLHGVLDLRCTDRAYFQGSDLSKIEKIICRFDTVLDGLTSEERNALHGKIVYVKKTPVMSFEELLKIISGNGLKRQHGSI